VTIFLPKLHIIWGGGVSFTITPSLTVVNGVVRFDENQ